MKNKKWKGKLLNYEIIMPIVMIVFIVLFIVNVYSLPKVAKRAPLLVGSITLFFLLVQTYISILNNLKNNEEEKSKLSRGLLKNKVLQLLLIMILYIAIMSYFGYFPSTIIMLVVTMWVIGEKQLLRITLVSVVFIIVFYIVFVKIFGLQPPAGLLQ